MASCRPLTISTSPRPSICGEVLCSQTCTVGADHSSRSPSATRLRGEALRRIPCVVKPDGGAEDVRAQRRHFPPRTQTSPEAQAEPLDSVTLAIYRECITQDRSSKGSPCTRMTAPPSPQDAAPTAATTPTPAATAAGATTTADPAGPSGPPLPMRFRVANAVRAGTTAADRVVGMASILRTASALRTAAPGTASIPARTSAAPAVATLAAVALAAVVLAGADAVADAPAGTSAPRSCSSWTSSPATATTSSRRSPTAAPAPGPPARARSTPPSRSSRTRAW